MNTIRQNYSDNTDIEYCAHVIVEGDYERPFGCITTYSLGEFAQYVEYYNYGVLNQDKGFPLFRSIFHNAPDFRYLVGPILEEKQNIGGVCLNYICGDIVEAFTKDHGPLLQVSCDVKNIIEPLISHRPDYRANAVADIPDVLKQKLIENGERQVSGLKGSGLRSDLKPVVKLHRTDGAGTWLLSELDKQQPDLAFGLCDLGGGSTVIKEISMSDLASHACELLSIELDDSFVATKSLAEYAEEARVAGKLKP